MYLILFLDFARFNVRTHTIVFEFFCDRFLTIDLIDASIYRFWQLEKVLNISLCSEKDRRCEEWYMRTMRHKTSSFFLILYFLQR